MELGRSVRELRIRHGHTQENLAGLAGIHVTYVSGIERGIRNPSLKSVRALASALGVPVGELLPPDDNSPPISRAVNLLPGRPVTAAIAVWRELPRRGDLTACEGVRLLSGEERKSLLPSSLLHLPRSTPASCRWAERGEIT